MSASIHYLGAGWYGPDTHLAVIDRTEAEMTQYVHELTADARELLAAAGCEIELSFATEGYEVTYDGKLLDGDRVQQILCGAIDALPPGPESFNKAVRLRSSLVARLDTKTDLAQSKPPGTRYLPHASPISLAEETLGLEEAAAQGRECREATEDLRAAGVIDESVAVGAIVDSHAPFPDGREADMVHETVVPLGGVVPEAVGASIAAFRTAQEAERLLVQSITQLRNSNATLLGLHRDIKTIDASNPNIDLQSQTSVLASVMYGGKDLNLALRNAESALKLMRLSVGSAAAPAGEDPQ